MAEFPALQSLFDKIDSPSSIEIRSGKQPTHLKFAKSSKGKKQKESPSKSGAGRVQGGNDVEFANSISGKSPEVMVKVSSWSKGATTPRNHMDYITRNGELEAETNTGEILSGKRNSQAYVTAMLADSYYKGRTSENTRVSMNMVLSMPGKGNEVGLKNAVRAFAQENFGANHQFAFVYHGDSANDHCHLMVKTKGFDGKQLRVGKADLEHYRQSFAQHLRDEGIEAAATPRYIRNVTKKAESQVVRHINNPKPEAGRAVRVANTTRNQIAEAVSELSGKEVREKPWEEAIKSKAEKSAAAISETIKLLEKGVGHDERTEPGRHGLGSDARSDGRRHADGRHAEPGGTRGDGGREPAGGTRGTDGADRADRADRAGEPSTRSKEQQRAYASAAQAALHQSGYRTDGTVAFADAAADLRAMRAVDVVSAGRPANLLLLPHAHDNVATRPERNDHAMRWPDPHHKTAGSPSPAERGLKGPAPVPGAGLPANEREARDKVIAEQLRQHMGRHFSNGPAPTADQERKAWIAQNKPEWVQKGREDAEKGRGDAEQPLSKNKPPERDGER